MRTAACSLSGISCFSCCALSALTSVSLCSELRKEERLTGMCNNKKIIFFKNKRKKNTKVLLIIQHLIFLLFLSFLHSIIFNKKTPLRDVRKKN